MRLKGEEVEGCTLRRLIDEGGGRIATPSQVLT